MAYFSHSASMDRSRSRPGCRRFHRARTRFTPAADFLEVRALLSTLVVANTNDSGPGSLRQAVARRAWRQYDSFREQPEGRDDHAHKRRALDQPEPEYRRTGRGQACRQRRRREPSLRHRQRRPCDDLGSDNHGRNVQCHRSRRRDRQRGEPHTRRHRCDKQSVRGILRVSGRHRQCRQLDHQRQRGHREPGERHGLGQRGWNRK